MWMGIKQTGSLTDGSRFKLHNRKWLGHTVSKIKQGFFWRETKPLLFPSPHFTNSWHLLTHRNLHKLILKYIHPGFKKQTEHDFARGRVENTGGKNTSSADRGKQARTKSERNSFSEMAGESSPTRWAILSHEPGQIHQQRGSKLAV